MQYEDRLGSTECNEVPQDRVEDEGRDTKEEIDRFTSAPETSA